MNVKKFVKYYVIKYRKEEFLCGSILVIIICLSLITPKLVQYFIDKVLPAKKIEGVILFAAAYIGVYLLIALLSILSKRIITSIENKIMTEVREKMYSNLLYQPLGYYRENKMGHIAERIIRDTEVIRSLWGFLIPSSFSSMLLFLVTLIIILANNRTIGVLSLLSVCMYILVFRFYNEKLRKLFLTTRNSIDKMNTSITDAWNGSKEIKIFLYEPRMINLFSKILSELKVNTVNMTMKNEYSTQLLNIATILGSLITLAFGGYYVIKGEMTIGVLVALHAYVAKLYSPAKDIADMALDFKKYSVNIDRFSELLYTDNKELSVEAKDIIDLKDGDISFENISFSYGENQVLDNLSFTSNNKEVTAIVGKSGSGKSTILNLLLGFIKPNSGHIKIGNHDISTIPLDILRQHIGIVSQDMYLFNMSIYDNIKIGNPKAKEEEIQALIKHLEIDKIVENYPDKLNTMVTEFGKNLSGGQIQRISIARALLKKPSIIIFDEATSAIDSQTEQVIQSIIEKLKEDTHVILVSHRLSSLKSANHILVLNNGEIVESGSFDSLTEKKGLFYELFKDQIVINAAII